MDKVLEERLAAKDSYIDIHDFYVLMAFYQSISQKVLRKFDKDGSILEVQKKYEESRETVQDAQFIIAPQDHIIIITKCIRPINLNMLNS